MASFQWMCLHSEQCLRVGEREEEAETFTELQLAGCRHLGLGSRGLPHSAPVHSRVDIVTAVQMPLRPKHVKGLSPSKFPPLT